MPASDYQDGVQGAGQTWQERVDTEDSEEAYEDGATSEAASNYESEAGASRSEYESGIAEYLGIDEEDVTVGGAYSSGVEGAGDSWRDGVSESGSKWRDGVQRTDANEWEQAASDAADEWFDGYTEGVQS